MSVDFDPSESKAARSLYRWHGIVSQPNYRVIEYFKRYGNPADPTVFDNCSTKTSEYAYRAFGPAALVGAAAFLAKSATLHQTGYLFLGLLAFEVSRTVLHILGFTAQKKNYIHVRGNVDPIHIEKPKIMSWNVLGFPAGMNYTCGGCIPFRDRFPKIVETIREKNPDTVIVQESLMDHSVSEAFINEFKGEYANFFIHNGPNMWGLESGILVMTKSHVSGYTFTPFTTNDWTLSRGFITMTVPASDEGRPAYAIIGTHMEAGSDPEDVKKRKQQLSEIRDHANSLSNVSTVILAGDTNTDAIKNRQLLDEVLVNAYADPNQETCTNELNKIRYPNDTSPSKEWVDQVDIMIRDIAPGLTLTEFEVVPAYERGADKKINSKKALSDHHAIVATFK